MKPDAFKPGSACTAFYLGGVVVWLDVVLGRLEGLLGGDPGEDEEGAQPAILAKQNVCVQAVAHRSAGDEAATIQPAALSTHTTKLSTPELSTPE